MQSLTHPPIIDDDGRRGLTGSLIERAIDLWWSVIDIELDLGSNVKIGIRTKHGVSTTEDVHSQVVERRGVQVAPCEQPTSHILLSARVSIHKFIEVNGHHALISGGHRLLPIGPPLDNSNLCPSLTGIVKGIGIVGLCDQPVDELLLLSLHLLRCIKTSNQCECDSYAARSLHLPLLVAMGTL